MVMPDIVHVQHFDNDVKPCIHIDIYSTCSCNKFELLWRSITVHVTEQPRLVAFFWLR